MDCAKCLERLYAYLDEELSPAELTQVRAHLDDCGGCEDELVIEQRFLARVRDCCHEDVAPTELRARVVARLRMDHDAPR
jgi:mycothiol system anti-sigma-R factor